MADIETVEHRHHQIEHDQIWMLDADGIERKLAVRRRQHAKSVTFQTKANQFDRTGIVIDNKNGTDWHRFLAWVLIGALPHLNILFHLA
jgi:hypothetical protein